MDIENPLEVYVSCAGYDMQAPVKQIQKCRINGQEHEVPMNTMADILRNETTKAEVPLKVVTMMKNAGHEVFVFEEEPDPS